MIHTAPNPLGDFTHMCRAPDGNLYGIGAGRIGRIVPGTWQVEEVVAEGGKFLAADQEGRFYFARGSRLFRLALPSGYDESRSATQACGHSVRAT